MSDLHYVSIAEGTALIARGALSPVERTRSPLDRIAKLDPQLDAFLRVTAERAIEQAGIAETEIASGRYRGPLHGVPFVLKDLFDTVGILTTGQSRIARDRVPDMDATVTANLFSAGAVLLGKAAPAVRAGCDTRAQRACCGPPITRARSANAHAD